MIVEGGKTYDIRLIPQTCNREEAIREIVGALDHLQAISEEIFSTIHTRLHTNRKHVEALTTRVTAASEHISALKGAQKAIRIVSPAKYPCEISNDGSGNELEQLTFPTLVAKHVPNPQAFGFENDNDENRRPFRFDTAIKHPNDLLSIFHVKEPKLGDLTQLDNVADVGLGKPPTTVKNMDSFFLFNSIDNPYQNYKMTERSLQDRSLLKPARKGEEVHGEVCPTVATDPDDGAETKTDVDDFYYNPSALEIPDIDVPECLPNLPGIADSFDITEDLLTPSFSSKSFNFSSAVPPQTSSSKQPSLSSSTFQEEDDSLFDQPKSNKTSESLSIFNSAPSPPKSSNAGPSTATPQSPPPPPPPPPPVMAPPREDPKPISTSNPASSGGDLRSSLMAAIREAGGSGKARLKSATDRKYEAKKKKQDEKEKNLNDSQDGNDLMADLKNTLAMRRRGISGIPDGQNRAGVGDIMQSLAATIPSFEDLDSSGGGAGGSDDDDWG